MLRPSEKSGRADTNRPKRIDLPNNMLDAKRTNMFDLQVFGADLPGQGRRFIQVRYYWLPIMRVLTRANHKICIERKMKPLSKVQIACSLMASSVYEFI